MTNELIYDRIINFSINEIIPDRGVVYKSQGIKQETKVSQKITDLYDNSLSMFTKDVEPKTVVGGVPAKLIGPRRMNALQYKLGRARLFQ